MLRVIRTQEGPREVLELHGHLSETDLPVLLQEIEASPSKSVRLDLEQLRSADDAARRALVDLEAQGIAIEPVGRYMALLLDQARAELVGPPEDSGT